MARVLFALCGFAIGILFGLVVASIGGGSLRDVTAERDQLLQENKELADKATSAASEVERLKREVQRKAETQDSPRGAESHNGHMVPGLARLLQLEGSGKSQAIRVSPDEVAEFWKSQGYSVTKEDNEVRGMRSHPHYILLARFKSGELHQLVFEFPYWGDSSESAIRTTKAGSPLTHAMGISWGVVALVVNCSTVNQGKHEAAKDHDVMINSHYREPEVFLTLNRREEAQE